MKLTRLISMTIIAFGFVQTVVPTMSRCKLIETCLECSARTLTFVGEVCASLVNFPCLLAILSQKSAYVHSTPEEGHQCWLLAICSAIGLLIKEDLEAVP